MSMPARAHTQVTQGQQDTRREKDEKGGEGEEKGEAAYLSACLAGTVRALPVPTWCHVRIE
eukprot:3268661-Rhodomonas_salina.1